MYEEREFGGMRNIVAVERIGGRKYHVFVAIPTDFFKFANEVLKLDDLSSAAFYVDGIDGGSWTLGVEHDGDFHDLWRYTASTFPAWLQEFKNT
jgi:hypothetical protein